MTVYSCMKEKNQIRGIHEMTKMHWNQVFVEFGLSGI